MDGCTVRAIVQRESRFHNVLRWTSDGGIFVVLRIYRGERRPRFGVSWSDGLALWNGESNLTRPLAKGSFCLVTGFQRREIT